MTYTPEQRKAALAMLIANEWSCVDLACHLTALREALRRVMRSPWESPQMMEAIDAAHKVLEQTAPKERP